MKIRNGFVSNSSSSSFCIYGAFVECKDEQKEIEIEKIAKSNRLEVEYGPERYDNESGLYIGTSWGDKIPNDITIGAFKKSVEEKMEKAFGKKIDCGTISMGWYNG